MSLTVNVLLVARSRISTGVMPMVIRRPATAHWSFLYTLYLTAVYALFGPNPLVARLIQAVAIGVDPGDADNLQPAAAPSQSPRPNNTRQQQTPHTARLSRRSISAFDNL